MQALLDYLDRETATVTIYDFTGGEQTRVQLREWLGNFGVTTRTAETDRGEPTDVAVLHRAGEVLAAANVAALEERMEFEALDSPTETPPKPDLLAALDTELAIKPSLSVMEMVRISREFERRALRERAGTLHAGFQQLSQIADSRRTMETYTELADRGVDVTVYGYPDTSIEDVPFTVVEDPDRAFERHWFLLYDGNGNPNRTAALVSEERRRTDEGAFAEERDSAAAPAGEYDSYFTVDPATVDRLFEIAQREYGDILR